MTETSEDLRVIVTIPHTRGTLTCDGDHLTYRQRGGIIAKPVTGKVHVLDVHEIQWAPPPRGALTCRLTLLSELGVWDMTFDADDTTDVADIVAYLQRVRAEDAEAAARATEERAAADARAARMARILANVREINRVPDWYPFEDPAAGRVRYRWWTGDEWGDYED